MHALAQMLRSLPDYLERVVRAWLALIPGALLTILGAYEYLAPTGAPFVVVSHQQAVISAFVGALIAPFGAYWSLAQENRLLTRSAEAAALQRVTGTRSPRGAVKIQIEGPHTESDISAMERVLSAPIRTDTFAVPPVQSQERSQQVFYDSTLHALDFTIPATIGTITQTGSRPQPRVPRPPRIASEESEGRS
jgi:hypothetical protein